MFETAERREGVEGEEVPSVDIRDCFLADRWLPRRISPSKYRPWWRRGWRMWRWRWRRRRGRCRRRRRRKRWFEMKLVEEKE